MDDIKKNTSRRTGRPFILAGNSDGNQNVPVSVPPAVFSARKRVGKRRLLFRFFLGFAAFVLLLLVAAAFVLFKGISLGQSIQIENASHPSFIAQFTTLANHFFSGERAPLRGEKEGRINILLLGRAGEHYPGKNLTDTIIVMSIDTIGKKVALLSLPRDLFVPIAGSDYSTKLNALYQYSLSQDAGTGPLEQTIQDITGEPIHYFITLDFDGFEKIVDTLGGISLEVTRDFYDPRYPGKNYSYETFEIKKGWQTLDGATALKYVRERHNDPESDFGRAKRQQQVIQALKNKAFSIGTLTNISALNRIIDTLGENIKTDMTAEDMASFLELARTLDTQNVTTTVIDAWKKESLLRVSHIDVEGTAAFILVPRVGNWNELRNVSANIFHRDEDEHRKQTITAEKPTLTLYSGTADQEAVRKMATLLEDELGFPPVTLLPLPPFHNPEEESIITEQVGLEKPFSLDELLKRFSLTRSQTIPFTPPRGAVATDFTIVLGRDLAETFSLTVENAEQNAQDDAPFSEPLPPQPKKKH